MTYSQFACIGSGFSAIGLAVQLKRWYGITDICCFERFDDLGGTWYANKYPGCACDVPSLFYSFSFAANPNWTRVLASSDELHDYLKEVVVKYNLQDKISYNLTVEKCEWIEDLHRWRLHMRDGKTNTIVQHECQFLYSGTGFLVEPKKLDVPGTESFKGEIVHSARWKSNLSLKDKKVVVVGNGCTADQIVPAIVDQVQSLTQIIRSKHWIVPPLHFPGLPVLRFLFKTVPGFLKLTRFYAFLFCENEWRAFPMTKAGEAFRKDAEASTTRYMKKTAPEKYHKLLIPEFPIGCKRRIFDPKYLRSLHNEKVSITEDAMLEIIPEGVRTKGGVVEADVIILANGFSTNSYLPGIEVIGKGGKSITDHWKSYGGAEAYNSVLASGFPNFFFLLGPNTNTGHTSTIMAIENAINYSFRLIKPILKGEALAVDVTPEAEKRDTDEIQAALDKTVFHTGCNSWYVKDASGKAVRNSTTYPYSQPWYWYKCLFPVWEDLKYTPAPNPPRRNKLIWLLKLGIFTFSILTVSKTLWFLKQNDWNYQGLAALLVMRYQMLRRSLTHRFGV